MTDAIKVYGNARFGIRSDTLENWTSYNPVLEKGEPSIVEDATDENWFKVGDGVTPWVNLPYKKGPEGKKGDTGAQGPQGIKGDKGDTGATGPAGAKGDKGEKGNTGAAFTYDMFTNEQLAALTGPQGDTGPQGPQGDSYVLTDADKTEIAEQVLSLIPNGDEVSY